jgi:hypothetical protein
MKIIDGGNSNIPMANTIHALNLSQLEKRRLRGGQRRGSSSK